MNEHENPDIEPSQSSGQKSAAVPKSRRSLSNVKRELTDEELKSPAAQKLLIEELERLERERNELIDYRNKFYTSDKEIGILKERLKKYISFEIISSACFVTGAAALGFTSSLWETQPAGWISIIFGVILIIAGIWSKAVKV